MADDLRCFNCGASAVTVTEAFGPICETCAEARGVPVAGDEARAPGAQARRSKAVERG